MHTQPHDIIIRNKTTWVAHSYLMRTCVGLQAEFLEMSRARYKATVSPSFHSRDILPDTGKAWRWAKMSPAQGSEAFYYAYNNIPDKAPALYRSQLPALQELNNLATAQPQATAADFDGHFKTFLNTHYTSYLPCYGDCTKQQQINLAKGAAVIEGAIDYINTNNVNIKKYEFFGLLALFITKYDVPYIGRNVRVLKRKIEEAISGIPIVDIIRLPRANNENAAKGFKDEEIKSWVLQLRDMGQNFTNAFIIRKIKDMCTITDKPAPSDRWIGGIMEQHNVKYLTAQQRYGNKGRFSAMYRGYQPFQNALFAGDCWQVDGSRVNLVAHKGDGGQQFLYIVTVRDVHSGDVLGWHFDVTEDRWAVFNAIKMAVKEAGYLPYEIVFDKFPGHNTQEMMNYLGDLERWGTKITLSSDPNVKPGMERWFGTLQTVFMQESNYYYGQGIRSRRCYAHRSEEYIKRMRQAAAKQKFNWDDATAEATKVLEAYRNTEYCKWSRKHKTVQQSPAQLHEISAKPNVRRLEAQDYYFLFGLKVELPHTVGLIKKTIQGVDFYYRTADHEVISKHEKLLVCYDMDDLTQVMLYNVTDNPMKQFLGAAHEEVAAQRFGPTADHATIGKRKALIKELSGYREQETEYRKAVGDDITVLLAPMSVNKHQAEAAESIFLNNQHRPASSTVIARHEATSHDADEEPELVINNRYRY